MRCFEDEAPAYLPQGERLCAIAECIPEEAHQFDAVLCLDALDWMIHPAAALTERMRILRPEGKLVLTMPMYSPGSVHTRKFLDRWLPKPRMDARAH